MRIWFGRSGNERTGVRELAGRQGFGTIRGVREHVAMLPERRADQPNERASEVSEFGWEAGIRTPITWSRATCPTVGRPPSTSRGASTARTIDYSQSKTGSPNRPLALGCRARRARLLAADHPRFARLVSDHLLVAGVGFRRRLGRLPLLAPVARHAALATGLARFLARPFVCGAF